LGEFAAIDQAIVLSGGRLLVKEGDTPVIADITVGTVDTLGRLGRGPGEYEFIQSVGVIGGHPGVLAGGWRLMTWDSAGGVVRDTVVRSDRIESSTVRLAGDGTMYGTQLTGSMSATPRLVDTIPVMRGGTAPLDTLALIAAPAYFMSQVGPRMITSTRFAPIDAWGVLEDGTLWHVRASDLRVGRLAPGATSWVWSPEVDWSPIKTTPADRVNFAPAPDFPGLDTIPRPMAETKGPFEATVASRGGTIWLQRAVPANSDVESLQRFPADGSAPDMMVTAPRGRRLVAADDSAIYTASEDSSGLWELERWALEG
jgi:hypothetical protein